LLEDCKKVTAANAAKAKAIYEKTLTSSQHMITNIAAIFPDDTAIEEDKSSCSSDNFIDASEVDKYVNSPLTLPPIFTGRVVLMHPPLVPLPPLFR
jgi:hypothetical protein